MKTKNKSHFFRDKVIKNIHALLSTLFRVLGYSVFSPTSHQRTSLADKGNKTFTKSNSKKWFLPNRELLRRISHEIAMRILAMPIVILFFIAAIVYAGTRPTAADISLYPGGMGLYYKNVSFRSGDGTLLMGWFIPSLNADEILEDGNKALTRKRPGVVLCHDAGANREQLLALASTLNRQGIEVLLFDFRGSGLSEAKVRTFGLNEQYDVSAAVHFLKEQPSVDPEKIAVIGQGLGGVAAIGAASRDCNIRSIVVADVDSNFEMAVSRKLRQAGLLGDAFCSAFVWGCQTYFRANDTQMSTIHKAALLSENQSLLMIYHKNNEKLKQSAELIQKNTDAQTQTMVINSLKPCLLTDYEIGVPCIIEFLHNSWE
jgi:pimeloyl-ACP methyl ester carboxylesterase